MKGRIKEGKGEGRDSCFEEGRIDLRNKTSMAMTNTSRTSLQAGVKGKRWWRDGSRIGGTLKREDRERKGRAQEWLSCEKKYFVAHCVM